MSNLKLHYYYRGWGGVRGGWAGRSNHKQQMVINKFIPTKSGLEQRIVFLYWNLNLFYIYGYPILWLKMLL